MSLSASSGGNEERDLSDHPCAALPGYLGSGPALVSRCLEASHAHCHHKQVQGRFKPPICSGLLILVFQPSFQTGGLGVPMQGGFPLVHGPEPQAVPSGSQLVFHRHLHRFSPSYVKFPAFSRLGEMLLRPRLLGLLEASRLHLEEQLLGGPGGALPWKVAPRLPRAVSRSPGLL